MGIDLELFTRRRAASGDYAFLVDGALRDYEGVATAFEQLDGAVAELRLTHRHALSEKKEQALSRIEAAGTRVIRHANATALELRDLDEDALVVLVPILDCNQPAGLTALLEALAMGVPQLCPTFG